MQSSSGQTFIHQIPGISTNCVRSYQDFTQSPNNYCCSPPDRVSYKDIYIKYPHLILKIIKIFSNIRDSPGDKH